MEKCVTAEDRGVTHWRQHSLLFCLICTSCTGTDLLLPVQEKNWVKKTIAAVTLNGCQPSVSDTWPGTKQLSPCRREKRSPLRRSWSVKGMCKWTQRYPDMSESYSLPFDANGWNLAAGLAPLRDPRRTGTFQLCCSCKEILIWSFFIHSLSAECSLLLEVTCQSPTRRRSVAFSVSYVSVSCVLSHYHYFF